MSDEERYGRNEGKDWPIERNSANKDGKNMVFKKYIYFSKVKAKYIAADWLICKVIQIFLMYCIKPKVFTFCNMIF